MIDREYYATRLYKIHEVIGTDNYLTVPIYFPKTKHFGSEEYNIPDIIESIAYYYSLTHGKIIFDSSSEGFIIDFIKTMNIIVKELVNNYNIPVENFYYLSGALPTQSNLDNYCKIRTANNFLPIKVILVNTTEFMTAAGCSEISKSVVDNIKIKSKKFISLNGAPRIHRVYFTMLLIEKNILEKGYYSLGLNLSQEPVVDESHLNPYIHKDFLPPIYENVKELLLAHYKKFPKELTKPHGPFSKQFNVGDIALFDDAYFSVVQETNFVDREDGKVGFNYKDTVLITEKTFRPMAFLSPFIVLNRPGSTQALREYGYKTFHPYIDESYDLIQDDTERLLAVLAEVERLCNLSDDEWLSIQNEIMPRLKYNYEKLMTANVFYLTEK